MITMMCFAIATTGIGAIAKHIEPSTDRYIRNRVVGIESDKGFCSGIQIQAPSGKTYILTAAHCYDILKDDKVEVTSEDGKKYTVSLVKIDRGMDLMLLTSPTGINIRVSDEVSLHEHVRTITRGGRHLVYKTEGEVLEEIKFKMGFYEIDSQDKLDQCLKEGRQVIPTLFALVCAGEMTNTVITALVIPGSSGGPAVNDKGELIGIVSTTSGSIFSGVVPLRMIKEFLAGR